MDFLLLSILSSSVIIGELDWIPIRQISDREILENAMSTGEIQNLAQGFRCTAFVTGVDEITTAAHCVSGMTAKPSARFIDAKKNSYLCHSVKERNNQRDFARLDCPNAHSGKKILTPARGGGAGQKISAYSIQYNCNWQESNRCFVELQYAPGDLIFRNYGRFEHTMDTLGGSSGSPVFNLRTHELIGVHSSGSIADQLNFGHTILQN